MATNKAKKTETAEVDEMVTENTETEAQTTEAPAKKADGRVPLFIPRAAANDEPNAFISVNGVGYLLPKGKTSMVPPYVRAEYERSVAAQNKWDEHRDELTEAANKPLPGTV